MSHAEIWDDSALVESWDEAVAEYKRYNSIHARGEKVEDVLKQHEEQDNSQFQSAEDPTSGDVEVEEGMIVEDQEETITPPLSVDATPASNVSEQQQASATAPSLAPPLPPHLVGAVQDEGLKNLLMSWYYAGYYTGLYEGQQKGQATPKSTGTTNTR